MDKNTCPKCNSGWIQWGGLVFGQWSPAIAQCLGCGLHSDQRDYYDAHSEAYRSMAPPHKIVAGGNRGE